MDSMKPKGSSNKNTKLSTSMDYASGSDNMKGVRGQTIRQDYGRENDYTTGSKDMRRMGELKGSTDDLSRTIKNGKVPDFP